jgi:hypothetical protein
MPLAAGKAHAEIDSAEAPTLACSVHKRLLNARGERHEQMQLRLHPN